VLLSGRPQSRAREAQIFASSAVRSVGDELNREGCEQQAEDALGDAMLSARAPW